MWDHVTRITAGLNPQGTTAVKSDVRCVFLIRADVNSLPVYGGPRYWKGHPAFLY